MVKIIGVRHGESTYNVQGLCNDDPSKPVVLTEKGKQQAEAAGKLLQRKKIEIILCSPFPRTKQTAEIINQHLNVPIHIDERLHERRGGFDGKHFLEWRKEVEKKDYYHYIPKVGESFQDEKKRITNLVNELKRSKFKVILLVSHEEPLQVLRGVVTGMSDEESYSMPILNAQTVEFEII